jgi:hypothetical protein
LDLSARFIEIGGTLLTKGNNQFGLQQVGDKSLEFFIYTSRKTVVRGELPNDLTQKLASLAGIYNGKSISLFTTTKRLLKSRSPGTYHFPFPLCGQECRKTWSSIYPIIYAMPLRSGGYFPQGD